MSITLYFYNKNLLKKHIFCLNKFTILHKYTYKYY